ncbi:MAG: ImmA/IrrE family metallo-endopeptidase, partial [Hyphomicrobiales bacterium]|nr:ImmA/IrrE family metallo-endopeptidase [Hyphomicrobiales bacterium]
VESVKSFHVLDFFERLKPIFPGLKLVSVRDESLPGAEAEANAATNTILIRESTLEGAANWERRARFILLEEICHIALGHTGPRHRNCEGRPTGFTRSERKDEAEARKLAALILMPTELVMQCCSAREIHEQFMVSAEAAQIRWEEVERIRRQRAGQNRPLPPNVADFLREAKKRGHRITTDLGDEG